MLALVLQRGETALMLAAKFSKVDVVNHLLLRNANAHITDRGELCLSREFRLNSPNPCAP
jgi:ankyrin repeat protein